MQQALIIHCCQWVVLEKLLNNREISKATLQFESPFTPSDVYPIRWTGFFITSICQYGMGNEGHLRKRKGKKG
jgi:hypothetical protein